MFGAAPGARAADLEYNRFDSVEEAEFWTKWWGANETTLEYDATQDAAGSATSGSLKVVSHFDLAANGSDNQFSLVRDNPEGGVINGAHFLRMEFDIRVDPSSPKRPGGDHGFLEFGVRFQDFSQAYFGAIPLEDTGGNWQHLQADIPINHEKIGSITGITIKLWSGGTDGMTGPMTFWVDNILLVENPVVDFGTPVVKMERASRGLYLIANGAGQWDRQNVRTVGTGYSWVDRPGPVSYSVTIAEHPPVAEWQTHIFLSPGSEQPVGVTAPDWDYPDIVFIQISGGADGSGYMAFRYKKDQPSANGMFFNGEESSGPVGALGGVNSSRLTGTWTVTFQTNTTVELIAPDGSSSTIEFPADDVSRFAGELRAYFGVQPNREDNINHHAVLSALRISGAEEDLDEKFDLPVDGSVLEVSAANPAGVVAAGGDSPCWLKWSLPAPGWLPQMSAAPAGPWFDAEFPVPAFTVGDTRWLLVTTGEPVPAKNFFRLYLPPPEEE